VTPDQDLGALVQAIVDANRFMSLGTADALGAFNRRSEAQGLRAWSRAEVMPPGEFRLYRATATEQFVLDDHDARLPVHLS
jgi:hypothetical protein